MNASLYTDEGGNWLLNRLFPMALQSDMLFEALILSMARYSHTVGKEGLIPGGVHFSQLRSSVLGKLHRMLSMDTEISTSDLVIHTIICLIAADVRLPKLVASFSSVANRHCSSSPVMTNTQLLI
jgi:hypothetical protein